VTFGNAKSIDLLAHNPETGRAFTVQVKTLRSRSCFPLTLDRIEREHIYVFVILNRPVQRVRYFIVPGVEIVDHAERFGDSRVATSFPGLRPRVLDGFEDHEVVVVNSNPATIVTDTPFSHRANIEPLAPEVVAKIIEVLRRTLSCPPWGLGRVEFCCRPLRRRHPRQDWRNRPPGDRSCLTSDATARYGIH
jgi:hypothetical protein